MLGRTRSRGRRPRSQVPEVGVLEESRVRREDGGDDTDAAVEKATRQDVVARESPQRPGGQVPGRGAAAARVQVLGSPAGVQDDLLEMVRQVAVRGVADTATELARIGNALEVFVHAGLDEASRPLEQADVPVTPPATAPPLAPEIDVLHPYPVRRVCRRRQHHPQLLPQGGGHALVGVEGEDPLVPRGRDGGVALGGDRRTLDLDDPGPVRARDRHRVVRRAPVGDDDLVGPAQRRQRFRDLPCLVERRDHDREGQRGRGHRGDGGDGGGAVGHDVLGLRAVRVAAGLLEQGLSPDYTACLPASHGRHDDAAPRARFPAAGRWHRPPARRARPTLSGRRADRLHAAGPRRGRSPPHRPAHHEVTAGFAALVAPRGEPRPPTPRPLRALRQREARGVPCPLGAGALSRAVQCVPLRCRRAERAAQDPAVGFQAPHGARRVWGRGRARRDQRLDARSRAFGARRPRARRPRPAAPRRAPRHGPRAVPARPGRWRAAAALRPPGRRGALAPHRGAARAAHGRGHGDPRAPRDRRAGTRRALRRRGLRPGARAPRETRPQDRRGRAGAVSGRGGRSRPAGALQPRDRVRRRVAPGRADRRRGVRARARGGLGLRPPGGGGEFGWRPRRRARRRDRLPGPGGRPRRVRRRDLPATRRPRARAARWRGRASRGRDLLQLGPSRARSARHRIGSRGLTRTLLLAFNFPPLGGGIARWMGELALRYPPNSLLVSTGRHPGSAASDAQFPQPIDHAPIRATRLRTINGLVVWTARASALARRARPGFAWCGELKPAGYPARWLKARVGLPYGVVVYGTELLLLEAKIRRSPFKRWTARELLGRCAVVVAISRWTAELARSVLGQLDCPALAADVRVVPLGTTPSQFRPGIDPRAVRAKYGLDGGPWLLTVSRLDWHKGIDTVIKALPAVRAAVPGARYAVAGVGTVRPHFERLVADCGMGDAVRFLGFVPDRS